MATMKMGARLIEYHDTGSDEKGKRRFTVYWVGIDALRLGKLRAQGFYADPTMRPVIPLEPRAGETPKQAAHRQLGIAHEEEPC